MLEIIWQIWIINDKNETIGLKEIEEEEDREELEGIGDATSDILLPPPADPVDDEYTDDDLEDEEELTDEEIDKEFNSVYESEFAEGDDE